MTATLISSAQLTGISGDQANFDVYEKLEQIAETQTISPKTERSFYFGDTDRKFGEYCPKFLMEVIWDVLYDDTDEYVRDVGVWVQNKILKVSRRKVAELWSIKDAEVQGIINRIERVLKSDNKAFEAETFLVKAAAVFHSADVNWEMYA